MPKSKEKTTVKRSAEKRQNEPKKRKKMRSEVNVVSKQQIATETTPRREKMVKNKDQRRVLIKEKDKDSNNNATILPQKGVKRNSTSLEKPGMAETSKKTRSQSKIRDDIAVSVQPRFSEDDEEELLDYDDIRDSEVESEIDTNDTSEDESNTDHEVILSQRSANKKEEKLNEDDPRVQNLLSRLLKEKIEKGELQEVKNRDKNRDDRRDTAKGKEKGDGKELDKDKCLDPISPMIKSPSDTTIYAPALSKRNAIPVDKHTHMINSIANFVEGIRLQQEDCQPSTSTQASGGTRNEEDNRGAKLQEARNKSEKTILEAEQFKAMVDDPRGKNLPTDVSDSQSGNYESDLSQGHIQGHIQNQGQSYRLNPNFAQWPQPLENKCDYEANDDAFFHITCHVDPIMHGRIERGEFVELEKLLPGKRYANRRSSNGGDNGLFRWITKNGNTYPAPAEKEGEINGIRRWEQAFRVYSTIYSKANPDRAAEIWQYIHVINTAASTFQWDNVAEYDFMFRQLMHANPGRSWAKTYTQMWNLTLKDHIVRQSHFSYNGGGGGSSNYHGNHNSNDNNSSNTKKSDYCWKFNRNGTCPEGRDCRWINRCKYCNGASHGYNSCRKRKRDAGDYSNAGSYNSTSSSSSSTHTNDKKSK